MKQRVSVYVIGTRRVKINRRKEIVPIALGHFNRLLDAVIPRALEAEAGLTLTIGNRLVAAGGPGYELQRAFRSDYASGAAVLYLDWVKPFLNHLRVAQAAGDLEGIPAVIIEKIEALCQTGFQVTLQLDEPSQTKGRRLKHRHLRVVK